jgi:hypothetical protein
MTDHLALYERLMWDAIRQDENAAWIDDSLTVDGRMCTMLKDGRIVLKLDEARVAELVAQDLGAVYQGGPTPDWLVVDPRADEATVRRLFDEATADRNTPRAAIARFVREIGAEIRALPELRDADWDSYSMVADVSGGSVRVAAFRYTGTGEPVPTTAPRNDGLIRELHGKTFGGDGRPWDVVLVKLRRDAPGARVTFSSGEAADAWRVTPENLARLPETLRWLPGEVPELREPSTADAAELAQAIAADILALPELDAPDWDTFALVAEVSAGSVTMSASFRYRGSGPPVPTPPPGGFDLFEDLRETTRGAGGEAWDAVLVKIDRETASLVMDFASGEAAGVWRVTPQSLPQVREALRPHPEDFRAPEAVEAGVRPVHPRFGPVRLKLLAPVHTNEDVNLVIGDRTNTTVTAAAWPEVSRHRHAIWAGRAIDGGLGLLVRANGADSATRVINYEPIGVVRMSEVAKRPDGGFEARREAVPSGAPAELGGVVDPVDLRDLLRRAAERDPAFAAGWRRPAMRPPAELSGLRFHDVGEDLLRRLPLPLSSRIELLARPERDRFQALIDQLREIADGAPPPPETAQRLDRPPTDLPPHEIPALVADIWLTPGNVSTIKAGASISGEALTAGWLAFTTSLTVGQAVMVTRPVRRSETAAADGRYALTADQIRPALIRTVMRSEAGRALVTLAAAPSAADQSAFGDLVAYLELLRRAYARDTRVVGTASGSAYRLWQAGRFTSLRALLSWQIGQLGFGAQAVLDLQAVAWPDRLRALTLVLQGVADGRPLPEATDEAAGVASAALRA